MGPATTTVPVTMAGVSDQNGCADLLSAAGRVYMSLAGQSCTDNDNDCYSFGPERCDFSDCSGDGDYSADISCLVDFKYFAIPTDDQPNNPNEIQDWRAYLYVYDNANLETAISGPKDVNTTLAIEVDEPTIPFGSGYSVGDNTGTWNASTTVVNIGNCPLNADLKGTNMTSPISVYQLPVGNIKWRASTGFDYTSTEGASLRTSYDPADLIAPRPTSDAAVSDKIYWGIGIPMEADAATYTGTNYISAALDRNNWIEW
jgi:hypothetical protein